MPKAPDEDFPNWPGVLLKLYKLNNVECLPVQLDNSRQPRVISNLKGLIYFQKTLAAVTAPKIIAGFFSR